MRRLVHFTILLLFVSVSAVAQDRYWRPASAANLNWDDPNNWSATVAGPTGAAAPTTANGFTAIFDGNNILGTNLNAANLGAGALVIGAGYTGSVTQTAANSSFTVNTTSSIAAGTIQMRADGAGSFIFGQAVAITGGTINMQGGVQFNGDLTISGTPTINPGNSTATFGGTNAAININGGAAGTLILNNIVLNKTVAGNQTLTLAAGDRLIAANTMTLNNGLLGASTGLVQVNSNLTINPGFGGALVNFNIAGPGNAAVVVNAPLYTSGSNTFTVNKPSPANTVSFSTTLPSNTIVLSSNPTLAGNFTVTGGTVQFPTNNAMEVNFLGFNINGAGIFNAPNNILNVLGNFRITNVFNPNTGTVVMTSSSARNLSLGGPAINVTQNFYNLTINNSSASGSVSTEPGDIVNVLNDYQILDGRIEALEGSITNPFILRFNGNVSASALANPSGTNTQVEFAGANNQTVNLNPAASSIFNGTVIFNKTGGAVTLASRVDFDRPAQEVIFTSGIVQTTVTNVLAIGPTTVVMGASNASFVDGPVLKIGNSPFTFPIGDGAAYAPVHLSGNGGFNTLLPGNTSYLAQYVNADPDPIYDTDSQSPTNPDPHKISNCEYWIIDQVGSAANGPRVWLSYENARSCGVTDPTTIGVSSWTTPGFWQLYGNGGLQNVNGVNYVSSVIGIGTVSSADPVFTLSTIDEIANPLPVTWLSFTGRYFNGSVDLNWSTSLEVNNEEYTIERSADGQTFTTIGNVAGVGNTTSISRYSFKDSNPLSGSAYYRIKQTDRDGKFSYSDVIRVSNGEVALKGLRLFPNPSSGKMPLTIENGNWSNKKVTITIYNAVGGIVRQEQITFGSDSRAKINVEALQKGSYFITTSINNERQTMQFFIQ